ncbi:MAG TPA: hypothetical protein VFJ30_15250 [Phycisphaerae bacterium]|nr:hypothetical protein [Phycisphaerae bacterium]
MKFLRNLRAVWSYLSASPRRLGAGVPEGLDRPVRALATVSAAWGVAMVMLWHVVHRLTFPALLHWIFPALACAAVWLVGPYRWGWMALARSATPSGGRWRAVRWAVLVGLGAWAFAAFHGLGWKHTDAATQLPGWLGWLWPRAMYRVMLLTPLWGAWAMLVTVMYHRPTDRTDGPTRRLAGGVSAGAAAVMLAVPGAGTLVSLMSVEPAWRRFVPVAAAVAAAILGGMGLTRRFGGVSREVLLGCNVLTQLIFLTTCSLAMS